MKRSLTTSVAAVCLLWAAAAQAAPVRWGYSVDRDRPAVEADVPGTGGITLTNELYREAIGASDVVFTSIGTFSSAPPESPDVFTNSPFTLSLTLTDLDSGETGTVSFSGVFSGILSRAYAQITAESTSDGMHVIRLGKNTYTVGLNSYVPPPLPGASNWGSIGGVVLVTGDDDNPPPPPVDTPEPSSLVLGALGLSFLGLRGWRKWRKA